MQHQPFWISGRIGVLLSTSETVYEWPPRGWRVPWWPTSLSVGGEASHELAGPTEFARKKRNVDCLLAELDAKIEQEEREREAKELLRGRRLSGGRVTEVCGTGGGVSRSPAHWGGMRGDGLVRELESTLTCC